MPDDQLRDVIQGLRSRLQDELEAQLETLARSHEQAVEEARRAGATEAEQRWAARMESANQEWTSRLEEEIATARAESEKRLVAEGMRVRLEATQAAAEAASRERREFEEALAQERQRAHQHMEAERERAERELAEAQIALENERRRAEDAIDEASRRPAAAAAADAARLLAAIRRLDEAASLSDVLTTVATAAASEAARVTLFVVNTDHLEPWTVDGAPATSAGWVRVDGPEAGLLGDAIRHHQVVATTPGGADAPAFAALPPGRGACAVPFVLGGAPVAVLYADEGPEGATAPAWQDAIQILGRHASACLAHLTALRTTQAMRLLTGASASQAGAGGNDDEQGARRYARLLVSEIRLYNESAVRLGRQKRDLLQRLRPEIDRARRLYDERVPASVHSRDAFFQQELVQTLADGDPALLG